MTVMPERSARSALSPFVFLAILAMLTGCAPAKSEPPSTSAPPQSSPSMAVPPSPASPSPVVFARDSVVITLEDRLRVRSKPAVSPESELREPLLPVGTKAFVLDGPVAGSGYEWYQILPIAPRPIAPRQRALPIGWVARSSREGAPWLGPSSVECRPLPATMAALVAVDAGTALACFRGQEIVVRARLVACNCEVDGPGMEPAWFGFVESGGILTPPEQTRPPADVRDWFFLHLDPQGEYTRPLPVGELVSVTGLFDHPDASRCVQTVDGDAQAVPDCRWIFAVTHLER